MRQGLKALAGFALADGLRKLLSISPRENQHEVAVKLASLLLVVVGCFCASPLRANIITVPAGLNAGDQYRLVFITLDRTTALSPNIEFYNAFVTAQAGTAPALVALGTNWYAIGSTSSITAKQNTDTDDFPAGATGVPIYRLDGMIVATSYDDLWDGTIQNPLYVAQDGTVLNTCCGTWTGTSTSGIGVPGNELGAPSLQVTDGAPFATASNWIQTSPFSAGSLQFLYAISDVLTVPEPGSLALLGLGLLGLGVTRKRKAA